MSESTGSGGLVVALIVGGIVIAAAGGNTSSGDAGPQPPNGTPVVDYDLNQPTDVDGLVLTEEPVSRQTPHGGLRHYAYCGHSIGGDEVAEVQIDGALAYGALNAGDPCPQQ